MYSQRTKFFTDKDKRTIYSVDELPRGEANDLREINRGERKPIADVMMNIDKNIQRLRELCPHEKKIPFGGNKNSNATDESDYSDIVIL